jgi:pSer/pThr/pTyr-binding forkhead associated (FHA) protein
MPILVGVSIDYKGKKFELDDDEISIGRTDNNVITLNNSSISGSHCVLKKSGTSYLLKDLESTNGTRVNGQPITEVLLQDRDVVHFGALEFVYTDRQAEEVDADTLHTLEMPKVEVSTAPIKRPETFSSVSPFGAPQKKNKKSWHVLITVIGVLALVCVALLFYSLFAAS